jgi:PAS domain S-box-containing protein
MIRTLYVDDEEGLLDIAKTFLEMTGELKVDTFLSVVEAEKGLLQNKYDAIISDYQMPEINGIEFLKRIRSRGDKIPFILFSGRGREEVVIEALNSGATFYLQKGVDTKAQFAELEHKVKEAVQRKLAEHELVISKLQLEAAMNLAHIAYWNLNLVTMIFTSDDHFWSIVGTTSEKENGYQITFDRFLLEFVHPDDAASISNQVRRSFEPCSNVDIGHITYRITRGDGTIRHLESNYVVMRATDGRPIMAYGATQDITERIKFEISLGRIDRELLAIKEINKAIIRAKTEKELLNEICGLVCDKAGYRLAWIGYAENDAARSVRPVAWAGYNEDYVAKIKATWADVERGRGPTGTAIRTAKTVFIQDWKSDERTIPWREPGLENGYRSSIAIPMIDSGKVIGALTLYSGSANGFTSQEIELLEEMTDDLTYGIINLRAQEEKQRMEEALMDSESEFRTLFDDSPDSISVVGIDGKVLNCNLAAARMVLMNKEEIIGKTLADIKVFTANDLEHFQKSMVAMAMGMPTKPIESQVHRDDGTIRWVEMRASIIKKSGRFHSFQIIGRDITERKMAGEALRESESRLDTLIQTIPDLIWLKDKNGVYLSCNVNLERFFGAKKADIVGKTDYDFVDREEADLFREHDRKAMDAGKPTSNEEWITSNSQRVLVETIKTPMYDDKGKLVGVLGIGRDITERKHTEDELRESEKRYRLLFDSASEAIIVTQEGMLRLVNPANIVLTGASEKELRSVPFTEFVHPDDRGIVTEYNRRRFRGESVPDRYVVRLSTRDRGIRWVEISGVMIDWEGQPASLNFLTDITERKNAEDALRNANNQLSLLNGVTRHDMLNQITILSGYSALLENCNSSPERMKLLRMMKKSIDLLKAQVEFTRQYQEIGIQQPKWQILHDLVQNARHDLMNGNLTIDEEHTDVSILADPMLEKVVRNLIDNVLRHSANANRLIISTQQDEGKLVLTFEDNGQGITDEERAHLFERGYGKNTGFGLYLSREILKITGMSIQESSTTGRGARFEIMVPPGMFKNSGVKDRNDEARYEDGI